MVAVRLMATLGTKRQISNRGKREGRKGGVEKEGLSEPKMSSVKLIMLMPYVFTGPEVEVV